MGFSTSKIELGRQQELQGEGQGQAVEEDCWLQGRNKKDDITDWLQKQSDLQTKDQLMTLYDPPESFRFPNYVSVEMSSLQPVDGCGRVVTLLGAQLAGQDAPIAQGALNFLGHLRR